MPDPTAVPTAPAVPAASAVSVAAPARPHAWRTALLVGACAAVGLVASLVSLGFTLEQTGADDSPWFALMVALDLLCGLLALGLLPWVHRRSSYPAAVGCAVASGVSVLALPAALYAIARVAIVDRPTRIAALAAAFVGAAVASDALYSPLPGAEEPWWLIGLVALGVFCVPLAVGLRIGSRRAVVAALAGEAAAARREQEALRREHAAAAREAEARLAEVRAAERAMIAREMHDSLSHELSLIAMHSGVLESRPDLPPERARDSAAAIAASSRRAGAELRRVLTVLRDGESSTEPPPDLGALDDLVSRLGGGADPSGDRLVRLELTGELAGEGLARVPPATSRHLYRIAQESLHNATRHAPGAPVRLTIGGSEADGIGLECRNRLPAGPAVPTAAPASPGAGLGLLGLGERARLAGGWCRAEARGSEFVVTAWLPWNA